jgi:hypothetical protein
MFADGVPPGEPVEPILEPEDLIFALTSDAKTCGLDIPNLLAWLQTIYDGLRDLLRVLWSGFWTWHEVAHFEGGRGLATK